MEKKTCLSIEQMQELKRLGITTNNASMCICSDINGKSFISVHDEYCYEVPCETPTPSFSAQDILERLPFSHGYTWSLKKENEKWIVVCLNVYSGKTVNTFSHEQLIDALYFALHHIANIGFFKNESNEEIDKFLKTMGMEIAHLKTYLAANNIICITKEEHESLQSPGKGRTPDKDLMGDMKPDAY